ncbi:hypothetical protein NLG97_g7569 [Lecanicillium saksenae]|uniref:Uncharacterized protein n=1 Tax=Lecanicillium saksenae TaxID=468837 RepID=A0ACC1QN49_9HYPO|nr:hypothetical protein NLG97_g7569 [Lecanicillium saksenae]
MGFSNLTEETGLQAFNRWMATRSYVESDEPSQADVACFKAIAAAPDSSRYPDAARWHERVASHQAEFANLPGDASKTYADYGPEGDIAADMPDVANADDDDVDLFASEEEEDPEAARIREQRLADYKARKATKPQTTAKSVLILDVKPWDDETDMEALEAAIRGIEKDGLVWGKFTLVPIGFGIKKLQVNVVVEDAKVSTQDLQDEIEAFEDYVQSSDIAAFQKL